MAVGLRLAELAELATPARLQKLRRGMVPAAAVLAFFVFLLATFPYDMIGHRIAPQGLHHLAESPSRRARENAARVRSDISGGGHIRTSVDAYVLIERGTGDDCASSTVPVVCGVDALAARLRSRTPRMEVSARQVQAVADALTRPLAVAV